MISLAWQVSERLALGNLNMMIKSEHWPGIAGIA